MLILGNKNLISIYVQQRDTVQLDSKVFLHREYNAKALKTFSCDFRTHKSLQFKCVAYLLKLTIIICEPAHCRQQVPTAFRRISSVVYSLLQFQLLLACALTCYYKTNKAALKFFLENKGDDVFSLCASSCAVNTTRPSRSRGKYFIYVLCLHSISTSPIARKSP